MNEEFKNKILTAYPDWHLQPLLLSLEEMADPMSVIRAFFDAHHLPQFRTNIRAMVYDALCTQDSNAANYVYFQELIEKLVEAAWLLLQELPKQPLI